MASSNSKTSFSSLPPELRIKVFRYVLPTNTLIPIRVKIKRRLERSFPGRILRVNKLFNAEAAQILYSENDFHLRDMSDLVVFLRRIGKVKCSYIQTLSFGTFWMRDVDAKRLGMSRGMARKMVADEISQCLPSLTRLTIGDVGREFGGHASFLKILEDCPYLMSSLPMLANVYYCAGCAKLTLNLEPETLEDHTPAHPAWSGYYMKHSKAIFEHDKLIKDTKEELRAIRSAAGAEAAMTRRRRREARERAETRVAAQAAARAATTEWFTD